MTRFVAFTVALILALVLLAGVLVPAAAAPLAIPAEQEAPDSAQPDASRKTFLPMVNRGLNVSIAQIEFTQAVQSAGNSVTLVQARPTVARIFVQASSANVDNLSVTLSARRGGVLLGGSPVVRKGVIAQLRPDRGNRTHSVNMLLPAAWLSGDIVITAQVVLPGDLADAQPADNRLVRALSFVRVPRLMLAVMPILHIDSDGYGTFPAPATFDFPASVQAMFPVPSLAIRKRAPYTFVGALDLQGEWVRLLNETIDVALADGAPFAEIYLAQVADIPWSPYLGLASLWQRAAVTVDTGLVPAHELGHTFGRLHAPCGSPGGPDPDYPYANATIGQYGWDTRTGRVHQPADHDIMSYCEQWISDYTYLGMMQDQILKGDPAAVRTSAAGESLVLIQADVSDGSNVHILPVYTVQTSKRADNSRSDESGDYSIAFVDAQGATLSEYPVQSEELEERGLSARLISALLPVPPGVAAAVELRSGALTIATRPVNSNAASADIAARPTAAIAGDNLVITLPAHAASATGFDGGGARLLVRHLHAHGTDTLAITDRSLTLPLTGLAGGPGRIEFVYPDLIPQVAATVAAAAEFTLPDRAPEAWIGAPRQAPYGAGVLVDGYASDPEDGALSSLRWSINGQPAGEGPVLQLDEVSEPLRVELIATDSQGQTASAQTLLAPLAESAN